jgi:hypothetical protein
MFTRITNGRTIPSTFVGRLGVLQAKLVQNATNCRLWIDLSLFIRLLAVYETLMVFLKLALFDREFDGKQAVL